MTEGPLFIPDGMDDEIDEVIDTLAAEDPNHYFSSDGRPTTTQPKTPETPPALRDKPFETIESTGTNEDGELYL